MRLTLRTILVLLFGAALSLVLYIAADSAFGQMVGPRGLNQNYMTLISAWRALGGSAHALGTGGQGFGGGFGRGGGGGRRAGGLTDGLNLDAAPGQTGSDLIWIGIPALLGAAIEIEAMYLRRRRKRLQKAAAARRPARRSPARTRRRT
jgi:hypothetical protein